MTKKVSTYYLTMLDYVMFYLHEYIFQQDYYFVLGDNRHHSIDSRNVGFVPSSQIQGKMTAIVSLERWKKFFLFRKFSEAAEG